MTPPHSPLSVGSQSHDYIITGLSYPEQRCSFIAHAVTIAVALAVLDVLINASTNSLLLFATIRLSWYVC